MPNLQRSLSHTKHLMVKRSAHALIAGKSSQDTTVATPPAYNTCTQLTPCPATALKSAGTAQVDEFVFTKQLDAGREVHCICCIAQPSSEHNGQHSQCSSICDMIRSSKHTLPCDMRNHSFHARQSFVNHSHGRLDLHAAKRDHAPTHALQLVHLTHHRQLSTCKRLFAGCWLPLLIQLLWHAATEAQVHFCRHHIHASHARHIRAWDPC